MLALDYIRERRVEADLLEGVHGGRVSSEREGELQHVQLHRADQWMGLLQDQLIVGQIRVCRIRGMSNTWSVVVLPVLL